MEGPVFRQLSQSKMIDIVPRLQALLLVSGDSR